MRAVARRARLVVMPNESDGAVHGAEMCGGVGLQWVGRGLVMNGAAAEYTGISRLK